MKKYRLKKEAVPFFKKELATGVKDWETWTKTYNVDEKIGDNNYNCPVVAYYSELLRSNLDELKSVEFLYPDLNISQIIFASFDVKQSS